MEKKTETTIRGYVGTTVQRLFCFGEMGLGVYRMKVYAFGSRDLGFRVSVGLRISDSGLTDIKIRVGLFEQLSFRMGLGLGVCEWMYL